MSAKYPVRLHGYGMLVAIRLPRSMGGGAKVFLREVAKAKAPNLFHQKVECGISGRSDSGNVIPINTVGRWLFGVPGYMGHVRVSNWEGLDCKVEFPKDSPSEVRELIDAIKQLVEKMS